MIRLLIADDEALERETLADIVARRFEHEVTIETAENGRKAADTAVLWGADLILMDIEMPGMNGLDAARAVLEQRPECKVIFVTAYSLFQYAHEAVHLGACDYLLKPVDPDELEASIRDIEETNRKVRANLEKSRAEDEAVQYDSEYKRLTEQIAQKRADRMALLNGADLPLRGLSVEDGALTYKGKHGRDRSGSDQLRVAAAIVRRLNPDCGFVLLDKLEQMDMTTLQEFSAWLEAEGLQAIATRVSTGSECQIIIEDGMVKDAETSLPPVTEKPQPKSWTKGAF